MPSFCEGLCGPLQGQGWQGWGLTAHPFVVWELQKHWNM